MKMENNYKKGFTLLETVVALAIIMGALVGPVSLVMRGLVSSSESKNRLIALNLAQEGIEIVRAIRENNILCASLGGNNKWDDNPSGGKMQGTYAVDVKTETSLESCDPDVPTPELLSSYTTNLNLDTNGTYTYGGGSRTVFLRQVQICSPPSSSPCNENDESGIPSSSQMSVASTVSWEEKGVGRNITLQTRLFEWE